MIQVKLSGFAVTGVLEFFKTYNGFDNLNWWKDWTLLSSGETNDLNKLFVFIYTNHMMRINGKLTVSVMLEFKIQSEAQITIISTGDEQFFAREHCEEKITNAIKEWAKKSDLIVKDE